MDLCTVSFVGKPEVLLLVSIIHATVRVEVLGQSRLDILDVNFVDRSNKYTVKEQHCRWGRLCYILHNRKLNVWLPFFPLYVPSVF